MLLSFCVPSLIELNFCRLSNHQKKRQSFSSIPKKLIDLYWGICDENCHFMLIGIMEMRTFHDNFSECRGTNAILIAKWWRLIVIVLNILQVIKIFIGILALKDLWIYFVSLFFRNGFRNVDWWSCWDSFAALLSFGNF